MWRIIHFLFTLISLSGFKHNEKQNHFKGFYCTLYIILKMKFIIFYQTGERFLKQDPNYAQPQLACLMQQNVLIKNKSKTAENKSQLGNKIISARRPVHVIVVHTNGRDYKSHSKQPNPWKTPDMITFYYVWYDVMDLSGILRSL